MNEQHKGGDEYVQSQNFVWPKGINTANGYGNQKSDCPKAIKYFCIFFFVMLIYFLWIKQKTSTENYPSQKRLAPMRHKGTHTQMTCECRLCVAKFSTLFGYMSRVCTLIGTWGYRLCFFHWTLSQRYALSILYWPGFNLSGKVGHW